jgi:hypothetical protein
MPAAFGLGHVVLVYNANAAGIADAEGAVRFFEELLAAYDTGPRPRLLASLNTPFGVVDALELIMRRDLCLANPSTPHDRLAPLPAGDALAQLLDNTKPDFGALLAPADFDF